MLLDLYTDCSGLQINCARLAFVRSDLSHEEEIQCSGVLRTLIETVPVRYLGLPLMRPTSDLRLIAVIAKVEEAGGVVG